MSDFRPNKIDCTIISVYVISLPAFQQLKQQQEAVERTVRGESANHVPQSSVIPKVLPQVIELESRRSSMMTMEVPLTELNYERAAKNEEIQKLKVWFVYCMS